MIVDAHQHFWHYNPREYDWIDDGMHVLRRDFMPDDLVPHMEQAGVDATIAVQTRQTTEETDWLLRLAEAHSFIAGVVGWIDLRADDVDASVEQLLAHPRLAGIRHIVQSERDDRFLLDPAFGRGIAALGRAGLPYDILIYPRHLPVAAEFVSRFPAQTFVLDHLAKPEIRTGAIDEWARDLRRLAGAPNVWCKLSGLVTEADWQAWTPEQIDPYLDVAFDCFGAGRLIAGSDWPVCTVAADYSRTMAVVRDYLGQFRSQEREAVLGGNARSVYLRDHRPGLGTRGSGLGKP
jgi:L-fuconolactonase